VDDASGEKLAYLHQRLLQEGAADAWLRPITMKKGRPGTEVAVLVAPDKVDTVLDVIFRESGSLGVRRRSVERWSLARDFVEVEVYGRPVRVKRGWWRGRTVTVAPEYEDAAAAAAETGLSLDEVMSAAAAAARALG